MAVNWYEYLRRTLVPVLVFALLTLFVARSGQAENQGDSLQNRIGQMVMVGFHGTDLQAPELDLLREQIADGRVGGVILFRHNITDAGQLRKLVAELKRISAPLPLLIAIDQEGGAVQRLYAGNGFTDYVKAAEVANGGDPDQAYRYYRRMAAELSAVGFNLNFGPVVDLTVDPDSPAIGRLGRSFGRDPDRVAEYAAAFIAAHRIEGILTCAKHFPGHGSAAADSHLGMTEITATWRPEELDPYVRLFATVPPDLVMSAHVFHQKIDPEHPASLSSAHIQKSLRRNLGFDGAVVSDDLQMGAVTENYGFEKIVVQAARAGNDILLFSNFHSWDPEIPGKVQRILLQEIEEGNLDPGQIEASYNRIAKLKKSLLK